MKISVDMSLCGRLVAAVACVLLGACGGTASTDTVVTDDIAEVRELIADRSFGAGVALSPLSVETVTSGGGFAATNVDTLHFGDSNGPTAWQMCQWWSRYDLGGTPAVRTTEGTCYANAGKRVMRRDDGTLLLEVLGSAEYDAPRRDGEAWPHLLVQQDFDPAPVVGAMSSLTLSMNLRVAYCRNAMESGYDEALHTVQAPFYLHLRNTNRSSEDYGKALWVGIPTFDYRYERLAATESVHWDTGTATYIYTVPPRSIWGDISFHDGRWHAVCRDILPAVRRALEAMRERGELTHSSADDMAVTGMNFGWEVPGTFDAAMEVRGMSLLAAMRRTEPVRVCLATTMGDIVLELDDRTPRHRDNFAALVREGYYDSLLFHRVIGDFMIQGGDPRTRTVSGAEFDVEGPETGERRYWESIPAEIRFPELYHRRGVLAAAREGDDVNPERRSSRTQFYIVWGRRMDDAALEATQERVRRQLGEWFYYPDSVREAYRTVGGTPHLDGAYTVFGHVVEGMETLEAIQRTPTDSLDRPIEDVRILRARIVGADGRADDKDNGQND